MNEIEIMSTSPYNVMVLKFQILLLRLFCSFMCSICAVASAAAGVLSLLSLSPITTHGPHSSNLYKCL